MSGQFSCSAWLVEVEPLDNSRVALLSRPKQSQQVCRLGPAGRHPLEVDGVDPVVCGSHIQGLEIWKSRQLTQAALKCQLWRAPLIHILVGPSLVSEYQTFQICQQTHLTQEGSLDSVAMFDPGMAHCIVHFLDWHMVIGLRQLDLAVKCNQVGRSPIYCNKILAKMKGSLRFRNETSTDVATNRSHQFLKHSCLKKASCRLHLASKILCAWVSSENGRQIEVWIRSEGFLGIHSCCEDLTRDHWNPKYKPDRLVDWLYMYHFLWLSISIKTQGERYCSLTPAGIMETQYKNHS